MALEGAARKIGLIGTGNMGSRMARKLKANYNDLCVYDKAPKVSETLQTIAKVCSDLTELRDRDTIITMLPNFEITRSVLTSRKNGLECFKPGAIIINTGTIGVQGAIDLGAELESMQLGFVDAPVSGGIAGAEKGSLTFMVSGRDQHVEHVRPILLSMGSRIIDCGGPGMAQAAKLCNNLMLAISMMGACEVYALAKSLQLSPNILTEVMNSSSGRCWTTEVNNPVPGILQNSPASRGYSDGFSAQLLLKDLQLMADASRGKAGSLPGMNAALSAFSSIPEGSKSKDMSILYQYLTQGLK
jgi:3-hydroxyisobutyrate dehydrogenase